MRLTAPVTASPRRWSLLVAAASALLAVAACAPEDADPPAAAPPSSGAAACAPADLKLVGSGTLTVGTDKPAFEPWFSGDDPTNGKGYESAVAYAVADELGFAKSAVTWKTVPFNASFAPGRKAFDFDINQVSITDARKKVIRAGIESVHPSQVAAARSLGLSHASALRFVVLPQALRRVVPPLLNDAASLQKDSGLVSILGVIDAVRAAQIGTAESFNYTPYLVAAVLFLLLTIPMVRITDYVSLRALRRQSAGR